MTNFRDIRYNGSLTYGELFLQVRGMLLLLARGLFLQVRGKLLLLARGLFLQMGEGATVCWGKIMWKVLLGRFPSSGFCCWVRLIGWYTSVSG